jgi:TP901 family phage tail tape measure protein
MADIGEIRARLILNADEFNQGMDSARNSMSGTSLVANDLATDIQTIQVTAATVGGAVAAIMGVAVNQAAQFEQKMSNIKSVSGANANEMEQLADLAKKAGEATSYSASEAADAISELLKAGLTVQQVLDGGLTGALSLAAAGELELADAAAIASTALNSFKKDNLSVVDAANLLAGAANASATDVGELKFGLAAVAAVASGAGMSFKDTTTALAVFAQNGLAGSDAGTSLKTMLMNLSPSTKEATELFKKLGIITKDGTNQFYDAEGKLKSLSDVTDVLRRALEKLNPKERGDALKQMFGSDAVRAGTILFNEGADGVERMADAMSKITAADTAATKLDNLLGSVEELKGSLETLGIELGEDFLPMLTDFAKYVTNFVRDLSKADVKGSLAFAGTAAGVALLGSSLVKLVSATRALFLTMGPAGWLITGASVLAGVIAGVVVHQNEMKEVSLEAADAMIEQANSLDASIKQFDDLKAKSKLTNDEFARFIDINSILKETADPRIIAALTDEQNKLREKSGLSNDELNKMVELNGDLIEKVPEATSKISEQGNAILENTDKVKAYNAQQYERIRLELDAQRAKAEANQDDYLRKEEETIKRINGIKTKLGDLDVKEVEQRKKVNGLYDDLAEARANHDDLEVDRLTRTIEMEEHKVEAIKKQRAEQANKLVDQTKELDKIKEQIGKLDEVKYKMAELELKQVGLTAKKGEEVKAIDGAIGKLEKQKKELQDMTPVNQRNTAEYQQARDAIQEQINKLQGAKTKVEEIIGKAQQMNAELGKDITKTIYQNTVSSNNYNNSKANALKYHTGGIVGRGQMPKLHVGGLASQFASMPNHNEVDVRLLRNEAVLTEAQQANLLRMIDAGFTNKPSAQDNDAVISLLQSMDGKMTRGFNAIVVMDDREVGRIVEPHVTEVQAFKQDRKGRF